MEARPKAVVAWSSGKDSAYALYRAAQADDLEIVGVLTTVTAGYRRVSMHGVREALLDRQAVELGLPCFKVSIPAECPNEVYDREMAAVLRTLRDRGVSRVVFGDLFLADIRAYREARLREVGMEAVFPLWMRDTRELAHEMIAAGIEAILTCVDPRQLDRGFVGRRWDAALLDALPPSVDPCGENGEFHTVVTASPSFRGPIETSVGEIVERDEFVFADVLLADLELREETPADRAGVRAVNEAAFDTPAEADLVEALHDRGRVAVSAVALRDGVVVGHVLLSTARIAAVHGTTACLALGPMAVVPDAQRQGIGTRLVEYALGLARVRGHRIVIVLGHPEYYPRFGFQRAGNPGVHCKYVPPDHEAFMILGLAPDALVGIAGAAEYAPEFDQV